MTSAKRRPPPKPEVEPEVDEAGNIKGTNHGATVDEPVPGAIDSGAEVGPEPTQKRGTARDRTPRAPGRPV